MQLKMQDFKTLNMLQVHIGLLKLGLKKYIIPFLNRMELNMPMKRHMKNIIISF